MFKKLSFFFLKELILLTKILRMTRMMVFVIRQRSEGSYFLTFFLKKGDFSPAAE